MKKIRRISNVQCEICKNIYSIVGIATHLRDTHKLTVTEYVKQYNEYRPKYLDYNYRAKVNNIQCMICNQSYGSERLLSYHIKQNHQLTKKEYILKYILHDIIPLCKCGCNQKISLIGQPPYIREYKNGHNPNGMTGKIHSTSTRNIMSQKAIMRMGKHPKQSTAPELEFEEFLIKNNIEYLTQVATEYGCIDFYLPNDNLYVEIDGLYWHPIEHTNLNYQLLSSSIGDIQKSKFNGLIRIRENDIINIKCISDLLVYNHVYDFNIEYKQKIISKEYFKHKSPKNYIWLILKFLRTFQPTFPYPTSVESITNIINTIPTKIDKILKDKTFYNNRTSNIGVPFLKSNFKSYWHSKYNGHKTPIEIYNDDNLMKKIIEYRVGINNSGEVFDFSLHQIIRGISAIRGNISFFKPAMAAAIYKHFIGNVDAPIIIDPCAGFGGRMIGFKSIYPNGTYIGIEPNIETYNELQELAKNFSNIELHNCKLEDYKGDKQCDLTFTSIPYYNTEIYSNTIDYLNEEDWKNTFIKSLLTFKNLVINVPFNLREQFNNVIEYKLINNTSHLNKTITLKHEYILKF